VHTGWTGVPERFAALLRLDPGERVWAQQRELLIDGRIAELSVSYFPAAVAQGSGLMAPGDFPPGGVVGVLEDAGYRVLRTYNEARARLGTEAELRAFGADPGLEPLHGLVVIEIIHGTYSTEDEALEALVSIRPAAGNVIVFETYEGEDDEDREPAGVSQADTAADL
jgi:GntR family transcriptional regulator